MAAHDTRTDSPSSPPANAATAPRELTPAAERALAEASARRAAREAKAAAAARPDNELGGRQGPDPVRYGDWENGGIASDF